MESNTDTRTQTAASIGAEMWARAGDENIAWAIEEYGTAEAAAKDCADYLRDRDEWLDWDGESLDVEQFILAYIASD